MQEGAEENPDRVLIPDSREFIGLSVVSERRFIHLPAWCLFVPVQCRMLCW